MKYLLKITFGWLTCICMMIACSDDDEKGIGNLALDKEDITIAASGGMERVNVISGNEWVAIADKPWVMISPANGIGQTECKVSVDSTLEHGIREAKIRFTCEGQSSKIITVFQTGFDKMVYLEKPEITVEAAGNTSERYFNMKVTTTVSCQLEVIYEPLYNEEDGTEIQQSWLAPRITEIKLDAESARPRTQNIRFDWQMNTVAQQRIARVRFLPLREDDKLVEDVELVVKQEAAPKIEDTRAGDSLALLIIAQKLNLTSQVWDASENMRNWSNVTLWEETDEGLPAQEAVGRVRSVGFAMFDTQETLPQEVRYLKYAETLSFSSNVNTMLRSIDLGSDICELSNLKNLQIFSYGLVSLPEDFYRLEKLETLDLSGNNLDHIPSSLLSLDNFPNLKELKLTAMRRWAVSDLTRKSEFDDRDGLGLHLNLNDSKEVRQIKQLFMREKLEVLSFSYSYLEGSLPDFQVGDNVEGVTIQAYTDTDVEPFDGTATGGQDTLRKLVTTEIEGKKIPRILPKMKELRLNLNFFTGKLPNWLLYHPYFLEWGPEILIFNQQENGKNSEGRPVGFDNEPTSFDYYYNFFPGYRDKYELKEEITE